MPECRGVRTDQLILRLIEKMEQAEHGRQALTDALWARLPIYVMEYARDPSGTLLSLDVQPQTRNPFRCTHIYAFVGAGQTGTLTLGRFVFPLPADITTIPDLSILLMFIDRRNLTVTGGAVNTAVLLSGEQVPTYGKAR